MERHAATADLGRGIEQLSGSEEQSRLSAALLTDDGEELARRHIETDVVDRADDAALQDILDREILDLQDGALPERAGEAGLVVSECARHGWQASSWCWPRPPCVPSPRS